MASTDPGSEGIKITLPSGWQDNNCDQCSAIPGTYLLNKEVDLDECIFPAVGSTCCYSYHEDPFCGIPWTTAGEWDLHIAFRLDCQTSTNLVSDRCYAYARIVVGLPGHFGDVFAYRAADVDRAKTSWTLDYWYQGSSYPSSLRPCTTACPGSITAELAT
jgi:hypothetical protein